MRKTWKIHLSIIITACVVLLIIYSKTRRYRYERYLLNDYAKVFYEENMNYENSFDMPHMAALQDYYATIDPKLKRIPKKKLFNIYSEIKSYRKTRYKSASEELNWKEISSNMGGRVRTLVIDPNDSILPNKTWAGAVTGGLWYTNDIYNKDSVWHTVDDLWESLSISSIIIDPNNSKIMYVGTGEAQTAVTIYRESSAKGVGIYKTTDGGESWELIPSTADFSYITDIIIRNENDTSVIYAGVVSGVYKGADHLASPSDGLYMSKDGGESWEQVLPNIAGKSMPYSISDIELVPSGRIYVGTYRNIDGYGGGTILWSDNGTDWTIYEEYKHVIENSGDPLVEIPGRVMLASTSASKNSIYAVVAAGGFTRENFIFYKGKYIIRSDDDGSTWHEVNPPISDGNWSTLAWHALAISVDPNNANTIYVGGLDLHKTTDGGNSWRKLSSWFNFGRYYDSLDHPYVHADQHKIVFQNGSSDSIFFCTDGGVFSSINGSEDSLTFTEKNQGFNSLQFYTCAVHPEAGKPYYVAGAQDNGTLISYDKALNVQNDMISFGDGAFCFFDDDSPEFLITSVYYNMYFVNKVKSGRYELNQLINNVSGTGIFINPADYNSSTNTIIANANTFFGELTDNLVRVKNALDLNYTCELIEANTGSNVPFSSVKFVTGDNNKVLLGTQSGRLYQLDNINSQPISDEIGSNEFPTANISCIEVGLNNNEILVTFSNYGVASVWYTNDGGTNWKNAEGNLPDMPVRWAIIHQSYPEQVYLATELGVWTCANISADNVVWEQLKNGFPNVRVDMLRLRRSDNMLLAATHGRGMFVTQLDGEVGIGEPGPISSSPIVNVFPNPVVEVLNIEIADITTSNVEINISDISGKHIYKRNFGSINNNIIQINTSDWKPGTYILSAVINGDIITKKIVK